MFNYQTGADVKQGSEFEHPGATNGVQRESVSPRRNAFRAQPQALIFEHRCDTVAHRAALQTSRSVIAELSVFRIVSYLS